MNDKDITRKIKQLVDDLNKWNHEYFDLDAPSVSDRVYDTHLKMLIELEEKYPSLVLPDSPTQKIGAKTKESFKKIKHKKKMLSLSKAYSFNEIDKFIEDVKKITLDENTSFIAEPKIDGLSISLNYMNGELIQAVTRGDGTVGEDVSFNVINIIKDIPTKIEYKNDLEVRGEIFIYKSVFEKINTEEKNNYANPRNLAAGTLRQLNSEIVRQRNLSSFIYDVVEPDKHNLKTQKDIILFLKKLGFNVFDYICFFNDADDIYKHIDNFEKIRNDIDYETDGVVIKLNEIDFYEKIGYTNKHPKFAIAYKYDDEIIETVLEDIFITIGRTGIATYNARFKPVLLKGTTVRAATLHNYNYIQDLMLNIGDIIKIKKAGEIIPKVIFVSQKKSNGVFNKILVCPYCHQNLIDTQTLNNQICPNDKCGEKNIRKIVHFASRDGMNIEGLAEGIVRKLNHLQVLNNIEDIFNLESNKEIIINQKGFGDKFWNNLISNINKSKNIDLDKLIFALGINQLGSKNAKQIAQFIMKFENILNIDYEQLSLVRDFGPVTLNEIKLFLNEKRNIDLINYLISIGINPEFENNANLIQENNPFYHKTIVITGSFSIPRNDIKNYIEKFGGTVSSSISKNTDIVLVGNNPGSKLEKAEELNIKKMSLDEFEEILKK